MKKIFASVILVVFLFNVLGYYGVYVGLKFLASKAFTEKIAKEGYAREQVIIHKVPFTLPYHPGSIAFDQSDGELQKDGEFYRVVKRDLRHDTLYTVYIKDHRSSSLLRSLVAFVKSHTDLPVSKSAGKLMKATHLDFLSCQSALQNACAGWNHAEKYCSGDYSLALFDSTVLSPPPKS